MEEDEEAKEPITQKAVIDMALKHHQERVDTLDRSILESTAKVKDLM